MTALFNRSRSRRVVRFGLPLAALVAIAVALLAPTLGSARTQSPQSAGEPSISGGTAVGDTLTGDHGTWASGAQSYKWNWRRCPPDGGQGAGNCEGIVDGPSNQYTLTSGDVGFTIRLQVKAFRGDGSKIGVETSNATARITGTGTGPTNTGLPTVAGTAQVGQTLTASRGSWASDYLTDFSYDWLRCDVTGSNCRTFGATGTTYVVATGDMGSTLRVRVTATNPAGTTVVMSAQTVAVPGASPPPPPPPTPPTTSPSAPSAAGCPAGHGPVPVAAVSSPARLVIDRQAAAPSVLAPASGQDVVVRYHVSDTCGQSVQGALVYATAVPFGQLSTPAEQPTGPTGYVSLTFTTRAGFPLGPKQSSVAIFVRARKQGEALLAGISGRRLFAIPVSR
jgi:hypothetical protein